MECIMKYYIADSAVFIMGYTKNINYSSLITVPSVTDELKSDESVMRFELARENGIRVEMPDSESKNKVLEMAQYTRDLDELSSTDIDILAKALEYKNSEFGNITLLTDDYAVQNVAELLKINVEPIAQKKIKDRLVWEKECIGCKKRFDKGDTCPICGSALKKKRKRKV